MVSGLVRSWRCMVLRNMNLYCVYDELREQANGAGPDKQLRQLPHSSKLASRQGYRFVLFTNRSYREYHQVCCVRQQSI